MGKKYSDADYEKLQYYHNLVSQNRAIYFQCFDNYFNYQLKLADKYTLQDLDNLVEKDYVEWEKLKNLFHSMLIARSEYEKSLRELYNFKIVLRECYFDIGVITDYTGGEKPIERGRREYKGVK